SFGRVWLNGGSAVNLTNSGGSVFLGTRGRGQMTVSNSAVNTDVMIVGNVGPGVGTLTMASGTITGPNGFDVGESSGATGVVWITGGTLVATNADQIIGLSGVGQMSLSNGLVRSRRVLIGEFNVGTFSIAGGTNLISTELQIGSSSAGTL